MISRGQFCVQINEIELYLKDVGLLARRNYNVNLDFKQSASKVTSFHELWNTFYCEDYYHFQFDDNALLFFLMSDSNLSFRFLGSPTQSLSFSDYKSQIQEDNDNLDLEQEYESYLETCPDVNSPIYLRYDFSPSQYKHGIHPASHFHIGYGQDSRIGLINEVSPLAFVCFILRQFYPAIWEKKIDDSIKERMKKWKTSTLIGDEFYQELDKNCDLYLK